MLYYVKGDIPEIASILVVMVALGWSPALESSGKFTTFRSTCNTAQRRFGSQDRRARGEGALTAEKLSREPHQKPLNPLTVPGRLIAVRAMKRNARDINHAIGRRRREILRGARLSN